MTAVVGVGVLAGAALGTEVRQTKALFLPGRPVAGQRFSAVITYWTGQGLAINVGGICQASIRTRQGGLQRRLGSGVAHRLPDDGSLPGANVWSRTVPKTAAGKVFVVSCEHVFARIDSTGSHPRVKVLKMLPAFVHRWRIARG